MDSNHPLWALYVILFYFHIIISSVLISSKMASYGSWREKQNETWSIIEAEAEVRYIFSILNTLGIKQDNEMLHFIYNICVGRKKNCD